MNGTDYRLTESDELRMSTAIRRALNRWDASRGPREGGADHETLRRIAAHSIGCSLYDLRDVEVQWIDNEIGEHELGLQ